MASRIVQGGVQRLAKLGKRADVSAIEFEEATPLDFTNATITNLSLPASAISGLSDDFDAKLSLKTTNDLAEGTINKYYSSALFDVSLGTKSTSDVAEGANLYYAVGRFDVALATKSTNHLAEGDNLYYTTARFDQALATKSTADVVEGANLYFTDSRAKQATFTACALYGSDAITPFNNAPVTVDFNQIIINGGSSFVFVGAGFISIPSACQFVVAYKMAVANASGNVEEDEEAKAVVQTSTDNGLNWLDVAQSTAYATCRVERKVMLSEEVLMAVSSACLLRVVVVRSAGTGDLEAGHQVLQLVMRPASS